MDAGQDSAVGREGEALDRLPGPGSLLPEESTGGHVPHGTLAPNGRLHVVGAVLEPIPVGAFSLILQQRSVSGSPTGSPVAIETMLDFAARHKIAPQTEHFPMSKINEAFARLASGKARYRIVLDADF